MVSGCRGVHDGRPGSSCRFRDNVKDVVDDEFVTAEELCTGEFADACTELGIE